MKIYLVMRGCYTDRSVGKIFLSEESAKKFVAELILNNECRGEDVYIECMEAEE